MGQMRALNLIRWAMDWKFLAIQLLNVVFWVSYATLFGLWIGGVVISTGWLKLLALGCVPYAVYVSIGALQ